LRNIKERWEKKEEVPGVSNLVSTFRNKKERKEKKKVVSGVSNPF